MQNFSSPDPNLVSRLFEHDSDTGDLIWKPMPREQFASEGTWRARNTKVAGKVAGHRHTCTVGKTYVQVRFDGRLHYAHRIVWVMHNGPIPAGMQIDHIDGDGTNNRLSNLRLASASENKRNMRKLKTNTTGYTGVYADRKSGCYYARVTINDKIVTLGRAPTAEAAYAIRQAYNVANGFHPNHGTDRPL